MKKILVLSLLSVALFTSCKKDKDPTIKGLWNIESVSWKYYVNNALDDSDTEVLTNATINFKDDGSAIIVVYGSTETHTYTVSGNTVSFDGETYTMQGLSENSVVLYVKETYAPGEYEESFIQLKR
ncbi:MAG: hypothetical protein H0U44_03745 [Flavisolibacter sp.]|jgi:hypothetical protein|nr:hypothetical protein [Flavisolibacter sp.]